MSNIGWWEIAIVLVLILIIFGPKKLPELGSSLGKSIRGFKKGLRENKDEVAATVAEVREATGIDEIRSTVAEVREAAGLDEMKSTVAELKRAADVKSVLSTKTQPAGTTTTAETTTMAETTTTAETATTAETTTAETTAVNGGTTVADMELPPEPPSTSKWVDSD